MLIFADQTATKDMGATSRKHKSKHKGKGSFFMRLFRTLGLAKKYHHRKSRVSVKIEEELEHQQPPISDEWGIKVPKHHKEFSKTKAKHKQAIRSRKKRKNRNRVKAEWKKKWQNALYFLNLRSQPFDPFRNKPESTRATRQLMRIRQFTVYIFNSTVLFLIAYIIAYLSYQLTVIFVASTFSIDSVLFYYEVFFPIGNQSSLWNHFNIIMITLSGPSVSLILGLVYYKFFMVKESVGPLAKLFFVWLAFHSFNMFFGAYVAGVITGQGFGYVANWLYLGYIVKFILAMVSLFILMLIGYHATKSLLETSNSLQRVSGENRNYFILTQTLVPWLIGGLILILIKIPNKDPQHENIIIYDLIILSTLAFAIVPAFFNRKARADSHRFKSKKPMKFGWLFMLIAILLIIAYRLGLDNGLHFIIRIMFRVAPYG